MNAVIAEKRPFYRKGRFIFGVIAVLLVLAILVTGLAMVFSAAPTVYSLGGAKLREDAYSYWFACQKYIYQIRYRDLAIEDSDAGWARIEEASGQSYGDMFRELIDEEIRLRFVAASLFDGEGYSLSATDRATLQTLVEEFEAESFGEIPDVSVKLDERYFRRIMDNIFSNTQKYADIDHPITLYSECDGDFLTLSCKNKVRRDKDIPESNGIGLKTCAKMMKEMGGELNVKETDGFFTVKITLPVEKQDD